MNYPTSYTSTVSVPLPGDDAIRSPWRCWTGTSCQLSSPTTASTAGRPVPS